ncbi:MAG TPA: hypothetical protein VM529_03260 [Gemmata sp.]|nr:hypothetical protein [Gemmata sp.]
MTATVAGSESFRPTAALSQAGQQTASAVRAVTIVSNSRPQSRHAYSNRGIAA